MSRAPVFAAVSAYRAAIGQLASSVVAANGPEGAICVIPGAGSWWAEADRLLVSGARRVIVDRPDPVPITLLEELVERGTPVLPVRPALLCETAPVREAGTSTRFLTVQAIAPAHREHVVAREAMGWLRRIGGSSDVRLGRVMRTSRASVAPALVGEVPASICLVRGVAADALELIEVAAIGEQRIHVRVDRDTTSPRVVHVDENGAHRAPARRESAERAALRRALHTHPDAIRRELSELLADERLAAQLLGARA